jgi:hypothetical protein
MSIIDEGIETQQLYEFLNAKRLNDAKVLELLQTVERVVVEHAPDAKLLLTSDKQGRVLSAAIYNAPLLLNHLGQFRPLQQQAPQRLSKVVECKATYHATLRLKIELDLWLDALFFVTRNTPALSNTLRAEIAELFTQ